MVIELGWLTFQMLTFLCYSKIKIDKNNQPSLHSWTLTPNDWPFDPYDLLILLYFFSFFALAC